MAGAQVALALVGLGAEAERRRHLDEAGTGAEGRVAGRGEQDAAVGMEPPGQGGHEVLVAALAGHQPVEAVEDVGRPGPSPARLRKAPLSTAASELASSPCRGRRPG